MAALPETKSQRWQRKLIGRIAKSRGPLHPPLTLAYRQIFILPTKFGFGFGLLLVVMGLGALNFNNNLGLLLTYLLAAVAQLTTLLAYRNLTGINLSTVTAAPVFAGEKALFQIRLHPGDGRPRPAIQASLKQPLDCIDLDDSGRHYLRLPLLTEHRGWLHLPDFKLETRYPLGLFRAWSWIQPRTKALVYPKPATNPPPLPRLGSGHSHPRGMGEGDQLHSLRDYESGDPLNRIAWKASARHEELYAKVMAQPADGQIHLDWGQLDPLDTERRLSIMTAWVLMAERRQLPYAMRLPGIHLDPGFGAEHRHQCLKALALFGI